jgi:hypothetical protein
MGRRTATRTHVLVALRRYKPNMSLRRLGDLIDSATLEEVKGDVVSEGSLAFGIVRDGLLRVTVDGETQWVGPGEVFGISQYLLKSGNYQMKITGMQPANHYLAFTHEMVMKIDA